MSQICMSQCIACHSALHVTENLQLRGGGLEVHMYQRSHDTQMNESWRRDLQLRGGGEMKVHTYHQSHDTHMSESCHRELQLRGGGVKVHTNPL